MVRLSFAAVLLFGVSALAGQNANQQQQGAVGNVGQTGNAGNNNGGGATGKKLQFITGACNNKEECESGCCAERDGKLTCAAPQALDGVKSNKDPKCDAKAAKKTARRLRV